MKIEFSSPWQCKLADMIWAADTIEEVNKIIDKYGPEALAVFEMILAASFDEIQDVSYAAHLLEAYK